MKNPFSEKTWNWIKTTVIACVGGGFTAALAAAFDPEKYNIKHDLGSGKLWEFFFEGAAAMFVGLLIKSPMGQQMLTTVKDTQAQLQQSRDLMQDTKADLKSSLAPPSGPAQPPPPTTPPASPPKSK